MRLPMRKHAPTFDCCWALFAAARGAYVGHVFWKRIAAMVVVLYALLVVAMMTAAACVALIVDAASSTAEVFWQSISSPMFGSLSQGKLRRCREI